MINKISDNKLMESFETIMPYFKYYLGENIGFSIANTESFLLVKVNGNIDINLKTGDKIPPDSAADKCIKGKKVIHTVLPESVFGIPLETIAVPVLENGDAQGAIVLFMNVDKTNKKQKITELSNNLSTSLEQISSNAVDMADDFKKINNTNESIGSFIEDTKNSSKKTDEVLAFIQGIAKQTNLLGLNAAIESARAGEYGKGFSVVSSEIRNLSNSTKESINQIDEILNTIQKSITEIYERFENSNDLLKNQTSHLDEITATIQKLTDNAEILKKFADEL
ncbi:methyl-accepting chemotaxis protein [Clostridium sp. BJN0001]|uniref:methyl-accepting chemotaxis protein n=1 Tax=Clostridium sp. BJN0001 TaxID=2930219 RepID=UPI001FD0842A|nr:methyl-accepting chemotaxis protein [Clostridium sp. BJN0001]